MALPTLTEEERKAALAKATAARSARADLKARVKRGEVTLDAVLASEDPIVLRMRVHELLTALPKIGPAKAKRLMARCHVSESRRVGGLGENQRKALVAACDGACA